MSFGSIFMTVYIISVGIVMWIIFILDMKREENNKEKQKEVALKRKKIVKQWVKGIENGEW